MNRLPILISLVLLTAIAAGCGLFGQDPPNEARLLLDGQDGMEARIILSRNFFAQEQPIRNDDGFIVGDTLIVAFIEADTFTVSLPYDRVFDISERHRIYTRINVLSSSSRSVRAKLWIENDLRNEDLLTSVDDSLTFVYTFRNGRQAPPPEV